MEYEFMYSLRMALEYGVPEANDVQIIYAGVNLTEIPRPFLTIDYLQALPEELSAGHRSYYDTYSFQIGVYARDVNEMYQLVSKVRRVLRERKGHPMYSYDETTGAFEETDRLVPFYDNGFTPIGSDDNSDLTASNHGYFDVAIEFY